MGNEESEQDTDASFIRKYVGACYLAELTHNVEQIKRLLTPKE